MPFPAPGARSSRRAADPPPCSDTSPAGWAADTWQKNQENPPGAPIDFYSQLVPPRDEVTQKIWLLLGVLHFISPGQATPELSVRSCWQQPLCKHARISCCAQRRPRGATPAHPPAAPRGAVPPLPVPWHHSRTSVCPSGQRSSREGWVLSTALTPQPRFLPSAPLPGFWEAPASRNGMQGGCSLPE